MFFSLRENADARPVWIFARVTGGGDDAGVWNAVQVVDHEDVREIGEAEKGIRGEMGGVEFDDGCDISPEIVFYFGAWRVDAADGSEGDGSCAS